MRELKITTAAKIKLRFFNVRLILAVSATMSCWKLELHVSFYALNI